MKDPLNPAMVWLLIVLIVLCLVRDCEACLTPSYALALIFLFLQLDF